MSDSSSVTAFGPAASDYAGKEGLIVLRAVPALGKPRVAIAAAASVHAFGVIVSVGFGSLGQELRIADAGSAFVLLGATFVPGTTEPTFMADADGKAIPCTAGLRYVGRLKLNSLTTLVAGNVAECIIAPGELET